MAMMSFMALIAENLPFGKGELIVTALTPNAFRIQYVEGQMAEMPEWIYVTNASLPLKKKVKQTQSGALISLTTSEGNILWVNPDRKEVSVEDKSGKLVFVATQHQLKSSTVAGEATHEATLTMYSPADEYLFGLGQFQDGFVNVRGLSRRLTQVNTQISVPMFLSSKGYGLLWNNYGLVDFNPSDQSVALVKEAGEGVQEVVNVTSTTGGRQEVRVRNLFKGQFSVPTKGKYSLLLDVGQTMARRHNLSIDGKLLVDHRNLWLPPTTSILCDLEAGTHTIEAELERGDKPVVYFQPVQDQTVLRSPVAEAVDYTVFVGSPDEVIAAYRQTTGPAPMMPKWARGYIHCRERFHSSDEIVNTARRFRDNNIPLDLIVQDWQWWGKYGWNAMQFDEDHYPDPKKLMDDLHGMNVRMMLSVWSKIDKNSNVGKSMLQQGYYIPGTDWIDFFNPEAAAAYWKNFSTHLLPFGIDAWWQDATEPENDDLAGRKVWAGKYAGERFRNVYPLLVNKTVFEGNRNDAPERRAMILTRCGFPGIQRYGAAMWSGDVGNDFETLRIQIASGLGMQAAGLPWWTYDAGGFFRPGDQYNNTEYIERMLRWIEASVYLPMMRVHGYMSETEPWRYGPEAQEIFVQCIRQRYRLLPYIYSHAAEVSFSGGTLMRPLVFDFADDPVALSQQNEYMFGHSLLVHPVTEAGVSSWSTYLPKNKAGWYDRDGHSYAGGTTIDAPVTLAQIPVFIKGGTILPIGADRQSSADQVDGTMTLQVFPDSDAEFTLYEDDGTTYNYEQGKFSTIRIQWNDAKRTLTLDARKGVFPGSLNQRTFDVQLLNGQKQTISYSGKKVTVKL